MEKEEFEHATSVEGFLKEEQGIYLYETAKSLPDNAVIVEIGSYLGRSASFIAAALKESNKTFFAVDTFENHAMTEGKRDTLASFKENTKPFNDHIQILQGLSAEVVRDFSLSIDLLFIDGDHSYEGCLADLESWLPHVKEGGSIIFHDYYSRSPTKRVKVVVDQFCNAGKLEFIEEVKKMAVTKKAILSCNSTE